MNGWNLDMNSTTTVVALHAHPDDEAIFTGATLRRAVDQGIRVVLIAATAGEAGEPRIRLHPGETMRQRRVAELERACELLGVSRLVVLDHQDSGADGGPYPRDTLAAAPVDEVASQVERVVVEENAAALVHYDAAGIYRHIDHVQVHRVGRRVVASTGVTGYEATVDREALLRGPTHVVQHAAGGASDIGVPSGAVSLTVQASMTELLAKMAAMAVHTSQVGPQWLDPLTFASAYGSEWFVRQGAPGVLDYRVGTG
jgi:LmbE family N-acetylglucosaminyl deacetylase